MKEHTKRLQALLEELQKEEKKKAVLDPDEHLEEFEASKTIEDSGIIERILEGSDF